MRSAPHLRSPSARVAHGLAALAAAAFTLAAPAAGAVTVWDLSADFSTAQNPNGAWTYGWASALDGSLHAYDTVNGWQWYDSGHHSGDNTPTVWKNYGSGWSYGIAPGEVSSHPGWDGSFSVIRWTAPYAAQITVSGTFGAGDARPMSDYLVLDGQTLQAWPSNPSTVDFSLTLQVAQGDTLDFVVGIPIGGDYGYGSTPVAASISAVPEPATLASLLAGLCGVAVARRARRPAA